jgi:hypothetical protein
MHRQGDWIAWTLHLLFGLFVGAIWACAILFRRRYGSWLTEDYIVYFISGLSLVIGGIGSYFGDRLWIGDNYRIFAPDEPSRSPLTVIASYTVSLLGFGLCVYALLGHFTFSQ